MYTATINTTNLTTIISRITRPLKLSPNGTSLSSSPPPHFSIINSIFSVSLYFKFSFALTSPRGHPLRAPPAPALPLLCGRGQLGQGHLLAGHHLHQVLWGACSIVSTLGLNLRWSRQQLVRHIWRSQPP